VGGNTGLAGLGTSSTLFAKAWDQADPINTPDGIADPKRAVDALVSAAQDVKKKHGRLDIPWGDVFRFGIGETDLPGNGGPGPMGIFRTMTLGPTTDNNFVPVHGDTYVAAIKFSKPLRAMVLTSYGNATQPGSPHHTDQLPLLTKKQMRPVWFTRQEAEAHMAEKTMFGQ
jgi:acyl-homoserine-lactone acylase